MNDIKKDDITPFVDLLFLESLVHTKNIIIETEV